MSDQHELIEKLAMDIVDSFKEKYQKEFNFNKHLSSILLILLGLIVQIRPNVNSEKNIIICFILTVVFMILSIICSFITMYSFIHISDSNSYNKIQLKNLFIRNKSYEDLSKELDKLLEDQKSESDKKADFYIKFTKPCHIFLGLSFICLVLYFLFMYII